jgi:hypothetical protein
MQAPGSYYLVYLITIMKGRTLYFSGSEVKSQVIALVETLLDRIEFELYAPVSYNLVYLIII